MNAALTFPRRFPVSRSRPSPWMRRSSVRLACALLACVALQAITVGGSAAAAAATCQGSVCVASDLGSVSAAPTGYQAAVLHDSPTHYWPLDDPSGTTARDLTGGDP